MNKTPYLHIVDFPRNMSGRGSPQRTVFGVLGHTIEDPYTKTLGGLVGQKGSGPLPKIVKDSKITDHTEHHIAGSPSKTHIPGVHMGQIPYPGQYLVEVGKKL